MNEYQNRPSRRSFLKRSTFAAAGFGLAAVAAGRLRGADEAKPAAKADKPAAGQPLFKISLAEWSLNKGLFGRGGAEKIDHLDFPKIAKAEGIEGVEYVNQFFKDKAKDEKYLAEMKKRCDDLGVRSVLIMCDGEGNLGDPDEAKRSKAVENHHKWADAAKFLGCHSIRVNAASGGSYEEQV